MKVGKKRDALFRASGRGCYPRGGGMKIVYKTDPARYQIPFGNALVREVLLRNCGNLPRTQARPVGKEREIEFQERVRSKIQFWNE